MSANLSALFYLVSGVLFILALRGLSSPETSRQGNLCIIGMLIVHFSVSRSFSLGFICFDFYLVGEMFYRIDCNAEFAGFHSLVLAAVFVYFCIYKSTSI